jgi:hypothetical protein
MMGVAWHFKHPIIGVQAVHYFLQLSQTVCKHLFPAVGVSWGQQVTCVGRAADLAGPDDSAWH